jgi:hypothetical protein
MRPRRPRAAPTAWITSGGPAVLAVVALAAAPATPAAAADAKPAVKLKKNQAWVAPDWNSRGIRSIAIAPLRSVERNPEAEALARRGLEAALAGRPFRFRGAGTILEAVKLGRAEAPWAAAVAAAAKGAPLDSATAGPVGAALRTDALLFTSVTHWQRYVVDAQTRGSSFTQVGVDAVLYSLADGAVVWRGSFVEKGDGPYNEPQSGDRDLRDPSGNLEARKSSLEPPAYEVVIEKLMERVAAALPRPAPAPAAAPAGG